MKAPILRKRNYLYEVIVILELLVLCFVWYAITGSARRAILAGALTYYPLAWTLRMALQKHHRIGMRHLRSEQYAEALQCFEMSESFFMKYSWVDRFRSITMLVSSAYSYREMAIQNQAYCLLHLGSPKRRPPHSSVCSPSLPTGRTSSLC